MTALKTRQLTKRVEHFYQEASFIPAPSKINLYDADCVARIANDIALLGKDKALKEKIKIFSKNS
jgi:hypothetical protein